VRKEREELPEAAPRVVPVKLEAVDGCEGLFRVPPHPDPKYGGPGEIPPGFVATYHPVHGQLMTRIAEPLLIVPEPPATPVVQEVAEETAGK